MEPTQKATVNPEAMGVPRGTSCPMEGLSGEEAIHPPQSVGREFVRQYYTMLHQAPEQLHRFYSQNSSFLHERWDNSKIEEKPAVGQIEIYDRIKTMNFRDCHAKIFQVDSQLSVCHTVVVQVLGELSNNGEPLRKFMQTFILVPQTNKKYYVHNDIFRYQDEEPSFGDDAAPEPEYNNGVEEDLDSVPQSHGTADQTNEVLYVQQVEECVVVAPAPAHAIAPEEPEFASEVKKEKEADDSESSSVPIVAAALPEEIEKNPPEKSEGGEVDGRSTTTGGEARDATLPPQKLSWAEMASRNVVGPTFRPLKADQRNGAAVTGNARSTPPLVARSPPPPQQQLPPPQKPANHREQQQQQQQQQQQTTEEIQNNNNNNSSVQGRGMQYYPDQQQIFVGNLPHHMSDLDLKEFFEKYGKVLDIRINRKQNNSLPNFGFIVFDSAETVKRILGDRPLFYNRKFRINVEEKKRREDLIGSRPRSGNATAPVVVPAGQSPDRAVANGNFAPPQREEHPKAVNQQGGSAC